MPSRAKPPVAQNGGKTDGKRPETSQNRPQNANDHEQRARVHPAQPSYSVVVPAPELSSINVASPHQMGATRAFRKGATPTEGIGRGYLAASLCLMKAVTISFCARARALLAVVMWSPASTRGNCG